MTDKLDLLVIFRIDNADLAGELSELGKHTSNDLHEVCFGYFQKMEKCKKVTFAFLHTCPTYFAVLRGQNRKVAF